MKKFKSLKSNPNVTKKKSKKKNATSKVKKRQEPKVRNQK